MAEKRNVAGRISGFFVEERDDEVDDVLVVDESSGVYEVERRFSLIACVSYHSRVSGCVWCCGRGIGGRRLDGCWRNTSLRRQTILSMTNSASLLFSILGRLPSLVLNEELSLMPSAIFAQPLNGV